MNSPINDITTTPQDPPQFRAILNLPANRNRDMSYPKDFADLQKKAYPDLVPLALSLPADEAFRKVSETARRMTRWQIVSEDPASKVLEAVATTLVMRFKDDVVIEVRKEGNGSSVHMRSKSRLGIWDLGANADRIKSFLNLLSKN